MKPKPENAETKKFTNVNSKTNGLNPNVANATDKGTSPRAARASTGRNPTPPNADVAAAAPESVEAADVSAAASQKENQCDNATRLSSVVSDKTEQVNWQFGNSCS